MEGALHISSELGVQFFAEPNGAPRQRKALARPADPHLDIQAMLGEDYSELCTR